MDNLERIVEPLRDLPDRVTKVEEQIVQLRTEMRDEFSAIRRDMVTKQDAARFATKDDLADLKNQMLVLHEAVIERLKVLSDARPRPKGPTKKP